MFLFKYHLRERLLNFSVGCGKWKVAKQEVNKMKTFHGLVVIHLRRF